MPSLVQLFIIENLEKQHILIFEMVNKKGTFGIFACLT